MKKTICILLALLLVLTLLPAGALAAGEPAEASARALRVDGKRVSCEACEIGGEVWFKLRDLALALSNTGSRFAVDWDGETRTVLLTTGEDYVPNGSEGKPISGSAAAVPGTGSLRIDGIEQSGLVAWNIGGHNYFRLGDLAPILGFQADYDRESDTAVIRAKARYERSPWLVRIYTDEISGLTLICQVAFDPNPWLIREEIVSTNDGRSSHEVTAYGEDGRPLTVTTYGDNYTTTVTYRYDELGRETQRIFDTLYEDGTARQSVTVSEYDFWGQLAKLSSDGGESVTTFTYDESGNQTAMEQVLESPVGQWINGNYTEYDEEGRRTKAVTVQRGEIVEQWVWTYEEGGKTTQQRLDAEGNILYIQTDESDGAAQVTTQDYGAYSVVTTTTVDENGNRVIRTESPAGSTETTIRTDGEGRLLRQEWTDGARTSVTTCEYDEAGHLVRQASGAPEAPSAVNEIRYDASGLVLSSAYAGSDYHEEYDFDYDPAERKMTCIRHITYPTASEMKVFYESITLPAGASRGQMVCFLPANSMQEPVSWSSSDEGVATVDERGIITAVSPGEAVITGTTESGLTASCTVTVTE